MVKEVFEAALQHEPRERLQFLEQACGDDFELLEEVASLLVSYEQAGSFIAAGAIEDATAALEEARALAGALGDKRALADIERNLGRLALKQGSAEAKQTLERALALAQDYGGKEAIALAHRAIGQCRARTLFDAEGQTDKAAEESFLTSIDLFREIGNEKEAARSPHPAE